MKKFWIALPLALMMLAATACGGETATSSQDDNTSSETESKAPVAVTEGEPETKPEPTHAPFPEANPNALTFDDGDISMASIVVDDDQSCEGTLSVETSDGNAMLKFTYDPASLTADNYSEMVQKIMIDVKQLLAPEQLETVYSISFDVYGETDQALFKNDAGELVMVPGWIGGGAGTVTADGKWYDFSEFSGSGINEYDMSRSDACHAEGKFMLASAGKKWDATMEEVGLQIMRWGLQNVTSTYIDNITFYDEEGNSIPLTRSAGAADPAQEENTEETAAESAAEATEAAEDAAA